MCLIVVIFPETLSVLSSCGVKAVGSDQKEQGVQSSFPNAESIAGVQQRGAKQQHQPNQESARGNIFTDTHAVLDTVTTKNKD